MKRVLFNSDIVSEIISLHEIGVPITRILKKVGLPSSMYKTVHRLLETNKNPRLREHIHNYCPPFVIEPFTTEYDQIFIGSFPIGFWIEREETIESVNQKMKELKENESYKERNRSDNGDNNVNTSSNNSCNSSDSNNDTGNFSQKSKHHHNSSTGNISDMAIPDDTKHDIPVKNSSDKSASLNILNIDSDEESKEEDKNPENLYDTI